jgi:tRNA-splicing ligase RtcB
MPVDCAENRRATMDAVLRVLHEELRVSSRAVNACNHTARETHFGEEVLVTRKGAVRAGRGELGIIPGSMGARSYIVRGLGNAESFESCSHGAGRRMSRTEARKRFTVDQHVAATEGVECRKDADVIDETPAAYKDIDAVMEAQRDLVEIVHTLKQVVCVKG